MREAFDTVVGRAGARGVDGKVRRACHAWEHGPTNCSMRHATTSSGSDGRSRCRFPRVRGRRRRRARGGRFARRSLPALISPQGVPLDELRGLADMALASAQELVKSIECAATITRADVRDDLDDFLQALERLIESSEHQRRANRPVAAPARRQRRVARALLLLHQLSQALETATDAYAHAGQRLARLPAWRRSSDELRRSSRHATPPSTSTGSPTTGRGRAADQGGGGLEGAQSDAACVAAACSVPPCFVSAPVFAALISTAVPAMLEHGLDDVLERELEPLARPAGRLFGDPKRPLLVSVRSGAPGFPCRA